MKHLLLTTIAAVVLVECGESPPDISIHDAAFEGDIEAVKQHLSAGADVNAKNDDGETPLDFARGETADLLRKHGGKHGVISGAAAIGDIEAVKEFLAAGTDVNAKNLSEWTPLHSAALNGHKEIVELLIAEGADVNAKNGFGETPLHSAIALDNKEVAELLISKGADVNAKEKLADATPLYLAAKFGYKKIAELLIAKGADVNAKDDDGITRLDWAIDRKYSEIADLLRKHGGKTGEELKVEGK